jgi:O-methyltransferase involved in polyketide biosynthesis
MMNSGRNSVRKFEQGAQNLMAKIKEVPPDMGHYAASQRAAHQILDNPRISEEPLALRIIGAEAETKLRLSLAQFQKPAGRDLHTFMAVRHRYAENELARAIQRGVRQYVILGAGLDTFAYRNSFPLLRVFEVDQPAAKRWSNRSWLNPVVRWREYQPRSSSWPCILCFPEVVA